MSSQRIRFANRVADRESSRSERLMYYVGICPQCEEGLLGIRVCGAQSVVLCDECDALWSQPLAEDNQPLMMQADPPCPECGASLWDEQAHWAERLEVENTGWWGQVVGEAGERDEPGGPRTPDRIDPLVRDDDHTYRDPDSDVTSTSDDSKAG